jgi:hypothetical protein
VKSKVSRNIKVQNKVSKNNRLKSVGDLGGRQNQTQVYQDEGDSSLLASQKQNELLSIA